MSGKWAQYFVLLLFLVSAVVGPLVDKSFAQKKNFGVWIGHNTCNGVLSELQDTPGSAFGDKEVKV